MSRDAQEQVRSRRRFLKEMAVAGGATAFATVAGQAVAADMEPASEQAPSKPSGYRVTPHINTYYRKARI